MSSDTKVDTIRMNHTEGTEEEELGIYSDDDESAGDLSDDEPPITDQDTSGRPQSQFKLRVTSAIASQRQQGSEATTMAGHTEVPISNHLDAIADEFLDEQYEQLDDLDIGNDEPPARQNRVSQQEQNNASQQSNICKDTKIK